MKRTTNNICIWDWFLLLVCFVELFTQIRAFFPQPFGILMLLAGCVVISYKARSYFRTRICFYLALYFIVLLVNLISGDQYFNNIGKVIHEVAILFFTSILLFYVYSKELIRFSKWMIITTLAVIVYYSLSTYFINLENPGIVRTTVALINEEDPMLGSFFKRGLVNYQLPHAIPIIIPAIVYNIRRLDYSIIVRTLFIVVLISALAIVYLSFSATALLLSTLTLVLSFLVLKKDSVKTNLFRLGAITFIALPILFNPDFIFKPFFSLFSGDDNSIYLNRLFEIQEYSATGSTSGDLASRQNRYEMTLSLLKENILFGSNGLPGGHMAIIDRLSILGLIGWIPYICFIISQIKYTASRIEANAKTYYVVGIATALFMLTMKGMSPWEIWFLMFTIMPLMIRLANKIS